MYAIDQTIKIKWFDGFEESGKIKKIADIKEGETTYYYSIEENGKKGTACFTNININKNQCTVEEC
jgi:hypothetical protein